MIAMVEVVAPVLQFTLPVAGTVNITVCPLHKIVLEGVIENAAVGDIIVTVAIVVAKQLALDASNV